MLKKLDSMIDQLPKTPREKRKIELKEKPKKLSQRVLLLSKVLNPNEMIMIWTPGRKQLNSRTELAKILLEVRKMERRK
jgi:hypothetical protein